MGYTLVKSTRLLRHNIRVLLRARGLTQHDIAFAFNKSDAWIAKILSDKSDADDPQKQKRDLPMKHLDALADFFGLSPYQLLQPGISPMTERRSPMDRRAGKDRRAKLGAKPGEVPAMDLHLTAEDIADVLRLRALGAKRRADVRMLIEEQAPRRRVRPGRDSADAALVLDARKPASSE